MRRHYGWVIQGRDGAPIMDSVRRTRSDSIKEWCYPDEWDYPKGLWHIYRRAGYRCVKVELRPVEQPRRKGSER